MSTLEKSIQLLNTLPDNEVEKVYNFIQFICSQYTTKKYLMQMKTLKKY